MIRVTDDSNHPCFKSLKISYFLLEHYYNFVIYFPIEFAFHVGKLNECTLVNKKMSEEGPIKKK